MANFDVDRYAIEILTPAGNKRRPRQFAMTCVRSIPCIVLFNHENARKYMRWHRANNKSKCKPISVEEFR